MARRMPRCSNRAAASSAHADEDLGPRWNAAPTLPVLAVAVSRTAGTRRLGTFKWGLVPSWAKDPSVGNRMINARAGTTADKPAYRNALERRRCLIAADAFYEWKDKKAWAFARADGQPMAFAGLWEVWWDPTDRDRQSPPLRTCVIVTTEANEVVAPLHERMPVVLPPEAWDEWLDPDTTHRDPGPRPPVPPPPGPPLRRPRPPP